VAYHHRRYCLALSGGTMKDFAALIDAIGTFLWPVVAVVVLYILLPTLRTGRFRVKVGPFELSTQETADTLAKQIADVQNQLNAMAPAKASQATTPPEPDRPEAPEREAAVVQKVLWVDDKPSNNAFEIARLADAGVDVVTATSTQEALDRLRSDPSAYQALVTDMGRREGLRYSQTAGLKTVERARAEGFRGLAIIYTTADAARQHQDEARMLDAEATASPTELYRLLNVN
jgi:CheY-like chemotaxis protein